MNPDHFDSLVTLFLGQWRALLSVKREVQTVTEREDPQNEACDLTLLDRNGKQHQPHKHHEPVSQLFRYSIIQIAFEISFPIICQLLVLRRCHPTSKTAWLLDRREVEQRSETLNFWYLCSWGSSAKRSCSRGGRRRRRRKRRKRREESPKRFCDRNRRDICKSGFCVCRQNCASDHQKYSSHDEWNQDGKRREYWIFKRKGSQDRRSLPWKVADLCREFHATTHSFHYIFTCWTKSHTLAAYSDPIVFPNWHCILSSQTFWWK